MKATRVNQKLTWKGGKTQLQKLMEKKSQRIVAKMYGWILREAKVGTFSEKLDQGRKLVYVHLNSRFWGSRLAQHVKRCLRCPSYPIPEGLNSSQSQLLLIQFPANARRQQPRHQVLCPHHPSGKQRLSSRLLASSWPSPGYCRYLGAETEDGRSSVSLSNT